MLRMYSTILLATLALALTGCDGFSSEERAPATNQGVGLAPAPIPASSQWFATLPQGTLDVPPNGAILIDAWLTGTAGIPLDIPLALSFVEVAVISPGGTAVAGELSWFEGFATLVWRPDERFTPSDLLSVSVVIDNIQLAQSGGGFFNDEPRNIEGSFNVQVGAQQVDITVPVAVGDPALFEARSTRQVCCPNALERLCHEGECATCLDVPTWRPMLMVGFTSAATASQLRHRPRHKVDGEVSWELGEDGVTAWHLFDTPPEGDYCLDITSLVATSGSQVVTQEVCVAPSELQTVPHEPPGADELSDAACFRPDADCALAASRRTDAGLWLTGLALLGLLTLRRLRAA